MPTPHLSRSAKAGWACLLLFSNLLLFAWLFHERSPREFISDFYTSPDAHFIFRAPLVLAVFSILIAYLYEKKQAAFTKRLGAFARLSGTLVRVAAVLSALAALRVTQTAPLLSALAGFVIVLGAGGAGARVLGLKPFKLDAAAFDSRLEWRVLSCALGLGLLALSVFVLGSFGLFFTGPVIFLGLVALVFYERPEFAERAEAREPFAFWALAFVGLLLLAHLPLVCSAPTDYDVLEYHLAAPAQYLAQGRVSFLNENIYATFPEVGEMLYLFSMQVAGNRFDGLPCAHAILISVWVLSIGGVYALARRLSKSIPVWGEEGAESAAACAALLYALVPLGSHLAADFYVEHFQALFHLCAVICACAYLSDLKLRMLFKANADSKPGASWLYAAGAFGGLCCGAKYTGLLFTLAPMLVLLPMITMLQAGVREAAGSVWRVALPAVALFAPWMVRNFFAGGDPLYPLGVVMRRRIQGAHGLPDRLDHFEAAHRAGEISLGAFGRALRQLMPGLQKDYAEDLGSWPQLLCFAAPGVAALKSTEVVLAALMLVLNLFAWFFFSHRLNRFFFPQLSVLAALGGVGAAACWRVKPLRKVCVALCVVFILIVGPLQLGSTVWSSMSREDFSRTRLEAAQAQFDFLDWVAGAQRQAETHASLEQFGGVRATAALKPNSQVLFIGEAQTFYCDDVPRYSVVFNRSVLEEVLQESRTSADIQRLLKAKGVTHLYFNYSEWSRLDLSYALTPDPDRPRWQLEPWNAERRSYLASLLRAGKFGAYGKVWPEEVFPAYLKLTAEQYEVFEDFFARHTRRVWPETEGQRTCELRKIE